MGPDRSHGEEGQDPRIGIIGLGLIGGSIARALRSKMGITPAIAVGRNEEVLRRACRDGNIAAYSTRVADLADCDLVFVCVPVGTMTGIMDEIASFYKGIITDVASTKASIVGYMRRCHPEIRYIGGHPMAGSEKVGYEASGAGLFENAPYILCAESASLAEGDLELMERIVRGIGARAIRMTARDHDEAVGLISHLPHIAAYALVDTVRRREDDRLRSIVAGGFRDITRIASSDPGLWADILCDSGDTVIRLLDGYIDSLTGLRGHLAAGGREELAAVFGKAKEYRDAMMLPGKTRDGTVQLWVEIDDKPGMIARVSAFFSKARINIRDIGIQDSREYEGGSLRITLSSAEDAQKGETLLRDAGMTARIVR